MGGECTDGHCNPLSESARRELAGSLLPLKEEAPEGGASQMKRKRVAPVVLAIEIGGRCGVRTVAPVDSRLFIGSSRPSAGGPPLGKLVQLLLQGR